MDQEFNAAMSKNSFDKEYLPSESTDNDVDDGFGDAGIINMYKTEIGKIPLLTVEEEVELAKNIEKALYAVTAAKTPEQKNQAKQNFIEARNALVEPNLRFVIVIGKRYIYRGMEFSDIIQEGNKGLIRAAEKFQWRLGFRFTTYATWWIRQTIVRAIIANRRLICWPAYMGTSIPRLMSMVDLFTQKYERNPTREELKKITGYSLATIDYIFFLVMHIRSIEEYMYRYMYRYQEDEKQDKIKNLIPDPASSLFESACAKQRKEEIDTILNSAFMGDPRARDIIERRFSIGRHEGQSIPTFEEIAKDYGVSRERIRQIEQKVLKTIRRLPRISKHLKEYL